MKKFQLAVYLIITCGRSSPIAEAKKVASQSIGMRPPNIGKGHLILANSSRNNWGEDKIEREVVGCSQSTGLG